MNKLSLVLLAVLVAGCCSAQKYHKKHVRMMASSEETAMSGEASHEQERRNAGMMMSGDEASHEQERRNAGMMMSGEASHEEERRNAGMMTSGEDERTSGDDYDDDYQHRHHPYKKSYYKDEYEKPAYKKEYYVDEYDDDHHPRPSYHSYKRPSYPSYKKSSHSSW